MTSQIFAIIAPVFLLAAVGFIWARRKMPFDHNMVSTLVLYVGAPCLLLSQLLMHRVNVDLMADIIVAGAAVIAMTALAAFCLLKAMGLPVRNYLPAMMFPNVGNMGLPLCLFAFGELGLALAVAYFAVTSVFQFTLGIGIASGKIDINLVLRNPVLWALATALVLLSTDATLPDWALNTLEMAGSFSIPLMLMSLGTSLATLSVNGLTRALTFSIFRLAAGFGIGLAVAVVLHLDGAARGAVIIQSAMPTAVFNYLFASRYGNAPGDVAGIVLISTVLSFVTLPFLLAFVLA